MSTKNKVAMVMGCGGQDGYYLTQHLLAAGYKVVGLVRRSSCDALWRIRPLLNNSNLVIDKCDVTDQLNIVRTLQKYKPDLVFNLAAQSQVGTSYEQPHLTMQVTAGGCLNILEALRTVLPSARFYQAGTSEQFGNSYTLLDGRKVQNEQTPFSPRSPYACAKQMAFDLVRTYREAYRLWAVTCILHNHESPMRAEDFVTRKITTHLAELWAYRHGIIKQYRRLKLGNIDTVRDFGHAESYTKAMLLVMQQKDPKDYVVGAGCAHSVREFLYKCLDFLGFDNAEGNHYEIDKGLFRPTDVDFLQADSSLIQRELGWKHTWDFESLVEEMIVADCQRVCHEAGCSFSEFARTKDRVLSSKLLL